jgi:hypothetical protein
MKGIVRAACLAVLVMPVLAVAKEYGCDSVNWGQEVLAKFPNASKGCHSVMMKNNEAYAKYVAEVESVNKQTKEVTLHMLDTKDKAFSKVVIAPKEGASVKIDGKDTPVAKLKKGDKVSFYIPHDRWGLYSDPESTPITIVSREDL